MSDNTTPYRSGLRGLLDRWRAFANRIARVQTAVILTVVYGLIVIPLGLTLRLIGKSPLIHPHEGPDSAWTPRTDEPYTVDRFKRLF